MIRPIILHKPGAGWAPSERGLLLQRRVVTIKESRAGHSLAMDAEAVQQLPEAVLYRMVRGDAKGRPFGTPRNPRAPTVEEFNPRIAEITASCLEETICERRHGILPEVASRVAQLSDDALIQFRVEDPISATELEKGLSLTGGHHRVHEIIQRVRFGRTAPETIIRILVHD